MASDHMYGISAEALLRWILKDLNKGTALGIAEKDFFRPASGDPFTVSRYGVRLETPLGVAAGPHTQLAQNILAAWLCGARYIELKTVQVLDTITVAKPCIDMADEGYNCEWSQELTLDQSYEEYLKAWVLAHLLHDHLGFAGKPGLIFNMSAGYSMEGILSPTVQRFLDRMENAAEDVEALKIKLSAIYPRAASLDIPGRISDNLTISCMHGCPPAEVEKIALYFLEERKLNTTLKMNPTLLGARCVRGILNKTLGYPTEVPDLAFEHDLPYDEALRILRNCRASAARLGLSFAAKLTNTLETVNGLQALPESEKMIYMSGKALHPISIALASRLQRDFGGDLDVSFCAGLDAANVADTLACGLAPLTVCSDLLKPGGYGRLSRYLKNIREAMQEKGAESVDSFIKKTAGLDELKAAMLKNLDDYAALVTAEGSRYAKKAGKGPKAAESRQISIDEIKDDFLAGAGRVLQCEKVCGICVSVCPNRANWALAVPSAFRAKFGQDKMIFNLGDACNECGNCATFCPSYLPYRDKPRLHLSAASFQADKRGFYRESAELLRVKIAGQAYELKKNGGSFLFSGEGVDMELDAGTLEARGDAAGSAPAVMSAMVFLTLAENDLTGAGI